MLTRQRVLIAKAETTPGDAIGLLVGDGGFKSRDLKIQPTAEFEEIPREGFGATGGAPGAMSGEATFSLPIAGSGSASTPVPEWANVFLPACGLKNVGNTFVPDRTSPEDAATGLHTLTLAAYQDGRIKTLIGAEGTAKLVWTAGKIASIDFTFSGIWITPADGELLAPDYGAAKAPRWANASGLSIGEKVYKAQAMTLDLGNEVRVRENPNTASALSFATIVNAQPVLTVDPEAVLVATEDRDTAWSGRTALALAATLGSAGGNKLTITSSKLQVRNPQEGDRGGIETDELEFQINDDDLTLTFA